MARPRQNTGRAVLVRSNTSTNSSAWLDSWPSGARHEDKVLLPVDVPQARYAGWPQDTIPGNVARAYARMAADLRNGTRTAPTFDDAVALHRLIAAVEAAASTGCRVSP